MVLQLLPSCLSIYQHPSNIFGVTQNIAFTNRRRVVKRGGVTRPDILPFSDGAEAAVGLRVFVISDLHTDYSENVNWVKSLSTLKNKKDVLLVAGDVAETCENFVLTMSLLKDRFEYVFYVPGNHDLWCRNKKDNHGIDIVFCDQLNSLEKLDKLNNACRIIGVETTPMLIGGLGVVPLLSWHHKSFDKEEEITSIRIPPLEMACKDFHACKWPGEFSKEDTYLAAYFDKLNNKHEETVDKIRRSCSQIISFSHFLPRQELCPEKRMLFYPHLPKIIGSDFLETRIRLIHGVEGSQSACHVFGHTHFCWDAMLDGIRYVQAPLAYPRERRRRRRMNGGENWLPFCIYSDGQLSDKLSPCYWSDYYSANPRSPHNTQLAPWVAQFYNRSNRK